MLAGQGVEGQGPLALLGGVEFVGSGEEEGELEDLLEAAEEVFEAKGAEEETSRLSAEEEAILEEGLLVFPASQRSSWLNRMRRDVI